MTHYAFIELTVNFGPLYVLRMQSAPEREMPRAILVGEQSKPLTNSLLAMGPSSSLRPDSTPGVRCPSSPIKRRGSITCPQDWGGSGMIWPPASNPLGKQLVLAMAENWKIA